MLPVPSSEQLLSLHLEHLMRDTPLPARPPPETARAVAEAVILHLRDQGLTLPLPDGYLHLMIYRALRAVGPEPVARAWAAAHLTESTAQLARAPDRTLRPVFDPLIWPGIRKFSSVQLLSPVQLFATSWTAACQPSLSITNS